MTGAAAAAAAGGSVRDELIVRRRRLEVAPADADPAIARLLAEVDGALARLDAGTFGRCLHCGVPVEPERLAADPLESLCLECLDADQRLALERDLALAGRVQRALLPPRSAAGGWEVDYLYQPAGPVSGDYFDVLPPDGAGDVHFVLADVAGKGVAASLLTSHLHALFRSLLPAGGPLAEVVSQANRLLCESTLPSSYATLVCGRAAADGTVELVNAGHLPPLVAGPGAARAVPGGGLPIGLFRGASYAAVRLALAPGETLLLFTDGVSEAVGAGGREYGRERLAAVVAAVPPAASGELLRRCADDLAAHRGGRPAGDDVTLLAVRRGYSVRSASAGGVRAMRQAG